MKVDRMFRLGIIKENEVGIAMNNEVILVAARTFIHEDNNKVIFDITATSDKGTSVSAKIEKVKVEGGLTRIQIIFDKNGDVAD